MFQTEERDRVKMGGKGWEVCMCVGLGGECLQDGK